MEYGHDEATKQAQKDFLKVLHINPAYTKARISLGYNLQVVFYNNLLAHKSSFWKKGKNIFGPLLVIGIHVISLVYVHFTFPLRLEQQGEARV